MTPIRRILALALPAFAAALLLVGSAAAKSDVTVVFCGMHVDSNLKLKHNLDCSSSGTDGLIVDEDNIDINLAGHTIIGNTGFSGILDNGFTNLSVRNGQFQDWGTSVDIFNGADNASVRGLAITNSGYGVFGQDVVGLNVNGINVNDAGYGVILVDTSSSLVQRNTVTDADYGFLVAQDVGTPTNNVFTRNAVSDAGYGFFSGGPVATTTYSKNRLFDIEFGFAEDGGNGALITGNTIDFTEIGMLIDHEGSGPVSITNNKVTRAFEDGIATIGAFLDVCECSTDAGSTISGNSVTGTFEGSGFFDELSLNSTFSNNTSTGNAGDGFDFDTPVNQTISGNTARKNLETGILLEGNDPGVGANAFAFTNNTATGNQDYGMAAEFVQGGSGNVAKQNVPFDCYQIACTGSHAPAGATFSHAPLKRPTVGAVVHAGKPVTAGKVPQHKS